MKVPADAIIAPDKLTGYLLVPRQRNDKARFLAKGGFEREAPDVPMRAVRELAASVDAVQDGYNEYGEFYRQEGDLSGPQGALRVVLVWLRWHVDGSWHLVTVKPAKGQGGTRS